MSTRQQATDAKTSIRNAFNKAGLFFPPGPVNGISIGGNGGTDGYCVNVNLTRAPSDTERKALPDMQDGVPVVYKVIGKISARRPS